MNSILYRVCQRTISRGGYPQDMSLRISVFYGAGLITTEEYDSLLTLLSGEDL